MTQTVEDIKNDRQTETLPNKINLVNPQQEQHNPKSGSSLIHLDEVNLLKKNSNEHVGLNQSIRPVTLINDTTSNNLKNIDAFSWKQSTPNVRTTPVRGEADINLIRKKRAKIDMKRERKAAKTVS